MQEQPDSTPPPPVIDLSLHVGDRVERLDLTGEGRWGTITEDEGDGEWLVLDNEGHAQRGKQENLRRATRSPTARARSAGSAADVAGTTP